MQLVIFYLYLMFYTCAARFDVKGISKVLPNFLASEHQNQKILVLEFWWESQGFGFLAFLQNTS